MEPLDWAGLGLLGAAVSLAARIVSRNTRGQAAPAAQGEASLCSDGPAVREAHTTFGVSQDAAASVHGGRIKTSPDLR